MGQAVKPIQDEMDLTNTQMSFVLMAFTLAYGIFEVPTGHWGDRIGSRRILKRIVWWWSAFTVLTGACTGFVSLLVVRFLFGAGEAGAYPNMARVVDRWFATKERGRVQGWLLAGSMVGGAVAPFLAAYLTSWIGWRWAFVVFGAVGIIWVVAFVRWFRDEPARHPCVNSAELEEILQDRVERQPIETIAESVPWRSVFANRNIWLLSVNISCMSFTSYLYFSWYPKYLQDGRNLDMRTTGWMVSIVLGAGALGILVGGYLADRLALASTRRWQGMAVDGLAAFSLLLSTQCDNPNLAVACTAFSCLAMHAQQPIWWSSAIETSGKHVGALFGLMNSLGTVGAMASQLFFGAFTDWRKSQGFLDRAQWDPAIAVCSALLGVGAICWIFTEPARRVD
jgi:sugar phosphate permease